MGHGAMHFTHNVLRAQVVMDILHLHKQCPELAATKACIVLGQNEWDHHIYPFEDWRRLDSLPFGA